MMRAGACPVSFWEAGKFPGKQEDVLEGGEILSTPSPTFAASRVLIYNRPRFLEVRRV